MAEASTAVGTVATSSMYLAIPWSSNSTPVFTVWCSETHQWMCSSLCDEQAFAPATARSNGQDLLCTTIYSSLPS